MVYTFSNHPFYTTYLQFPTGETIPPEICQNPKFWLYFHNALGAIDRSHILISPPNHLHTSYWNCKGFLSQNALFICDFSLKFIYTLTGWEGSTTDARVYDDAINTDLHIPSNCYFLADAGYPLHTHLLVPYREICYHLAEWGHANVW